eukprot:scaffold25083_cov117-Cylindrotheca_fusiformis.AAC.1
MCCCCPPAIKALFCLWVQSGFSKGTVAGALTFFPPDPPLYKFERVDKEGNLIPDDEETEDTKESKKDDKKDKKKKKKSGDHDDELENGTFRPKEGEHEEEIKSPAQQLTERSKELRKRAKSRNIRDKKDAEDGVKYKLVLDSRLKPPKFKGVVKEAVKIPTKSGAYCAAIVYRCPQGAANDSTKTLIFSHGNATDIGAMFPLQAILANSLGVNVVSYDYSGYGESGGMPLESHTYTDIAGVLKWTVENICDDDESKVVLYGQSVGSGPTCYMGMKINGLGGMVLHSPFMSGMRVLTPNRALACLDIFPNIDRIRKAKCPVMLIHGRLDQEVPIAHGEALYNATPDHLKRNPWWVPDRGHNDITEGRGKLAEYLGKLREFLETLD